MTPLFFTRKFRSRKPANDSRASAAPPVGTVGELLAREGGDPVEIIRQKLRGLGSIQSQALLAADRSVIESHIAADHWPLPAARDRKGYFGEDHLAYWAMGLADAQYFHQLITERVGKGSETPATIVDFGGSSGRVLRHLALSRPGSTLIGTDIQASGIQFLRAALGDLVTPLLHPIHPPLPLADHSVDFLYALSVFTHIDEFEEAWLLEIKRLLRPGGFAFLTVHTERAWRMLKPGQFMHDRMLRSRHSAQEQPTNGRDYFLPEVDAAYLHRPSFGQRAVITQLDGPARTVFTFHSREYLERRWSRILPIAEFLESAHGANQDAVLLGA